MIDPTPIKLTLAVVTESFPIRGTFRIARGAKTQAHVVVATLCAADGTIGRGECVPYARYGETVDGVMAALSGLSDRFAQGLDRTGLQSALPPGAARNALDCALWDLEAKQSGRRVWELAGLAMPAPVTTTFTLSIDEPDAMAKAAAAIAATRPLLKLKLAGDGADLARVAAVRAAAPACRLIVDANEGWQPSDLATLPTALARLGVEMIEQPLPAGADDALVDFQSPVPIGADESAHGLHGLDRLAGRYDVINIKLDKTGGLTEALALRDAARARGLRIMVGCMVATSLSMAPALLLAQGADYVDLDGPLLLDRDRKPGLTYQDALLLPGSAEVWG